MAFLFITSSLLAFMCIIINKTIASFPDTQQQYVGHNELYTPAITQRDKTQERVTSLSVYLKGIYQDPNYELNGANEITALLPIPFTKMLSSTRPPRNGLVISDHTQTTAVGHRKSCVPISRSDSSIFRQKTNGKPIQHFNETLNGRPTYSDPEGVISFKIMESVENKRIIKSALRVFVNSEEAKTTNDRFKLLVSQIQRGACPKLIGSLSIYTTHSKWHEVDTTISALAWQQDPSENDGLLIECKTLKGKKKTLSDCGINLNGLDEHLPLLTLFLYSDSGNQINANEMLPHGEFGKDKKTPKRSTSLANKRNARKLCRLKKFHVSFQEDLEWNEWIIAPTGYNFSICRGKCPRYNSNHADYDNVAIAYDQIPSPCCVPTKMSPLKVLFHNFKIIIYSNMIADECGCR
ncbi:protein decapentaplegic-like [Hydractinia symbiolongicarpus]|uniref:protein decapentaplegic-like n=1 Tax=Hydractinia symbiolongicarpus TaxID=13093 RepID=UPI00254F6104|nr:protein decapentaplegic-like [Hydractinia symbiolongicarpus]